MAGLTERNIITIRPFPTMHSPVSFGTTLLAMSAPRRVALALGIAALLWLCTWWAL
jgi:hypothetical protein